MVSSDRYDKGPPILGTLPLRLSTFGPWRLTFPLLGGQNGGKLAEPMLRSAPAHMPVARVTMAVP